VRVPGAFDANRVLAQLQWLALAATLTAAKASYASAPLFEEFYDRYILTLGAVGDSSLPILPSQGSDYELLVSRLLSALLAAFPQELANVSVGRDVHLGKTRVFLRWEAHEVLDGLREMRFRVMDEAAVIIQASISQRGMILLSYYLNAAVRNARSVATGCISADAEGICTFPGELNKLNVLHHLTPVFVVGNRESLFFPSPL
jgi:myosin heavy subunit